MNAEKRKKETRTAFKEFQNVESNIHIIHIKQFTITIIKNKKIIFFIL